MTKTNKSGWTDWPGSKDETALKAELDQLDCFDWKPFSILYVAETTIGQLKPFGGFVPKTRYWEYLAQELLIEGEPGDWNARECFRMVAGHLNDDARIRAATRVLRGYRTKLEDPKWRGLKDGEDVEM